MHLACASNAAYLPHIAALMESLAASNDPAELQLHLLHDDSVSDALKLRLRRSAERLGLSLNLLRPTATQLAALPPAGRYPELIWYRILLPELLPSQERVLYLDADTLVLQDLQALWRTDLGEALLAAVAQHRDMDGAGRLTGLGIAPEAPYFNSGVLLMDLARMRREGFSQRLIDIGRNHAAMFNYPDQDAYNVACGVRWRELHPKWNSFASVFLSTRHGGSAGEQDLRYEEALISPAILHFEGSIFAKPWNYRCVHPYRHLYRAYRARSDWPIAELEGSDLKSRMLGLLPVEQQLLIGRLKGRLLAIW